MNVFSSMISKFLKFQGLAGTGALLCKSLHMFVRDIDSVFLEVPSIFFSVFYFICVNVFEHRKMRWPRSVQAVVPPIMLTCLVVLPLLNS